MVPFLEPVRIWEADPSTLECAILPWNFVKITVNKLILSVSEPLPGLELRGYPLLRPLLFRSSSNNFGLPQSRLNKRIGRLKS